jgi:hypothetical protein
MVVKRQLRDPNISALRKDPLLQFVSEFGFGLNLFCTACKRQKSPPPLGIEPRFLGSASVDLAVHRLSHRCSKYFIDNSGEICCVEKMISAAKCELT